MNNLSEEYLSNYEAFTENEISDVTPNGISLRNDIFIDFSVCAENFKKAYPNSSKKCIGEREYTNLCFTFYANPQAIMIKFIPRNKLIDFLSSNNTVKRFKALQSKINNFGYTTYDLS